MVLFLRPFYLWFMCVSFFLSRREICDSMVDTCASIYTVAYEAYNELHINYSRRLAFRDPGRVARAGACCDSFIRVNTWWGNKGLLSRLPSLSLVPVSLRLSHACVSVRRACNQISLCTLYTAVRNSVHYGNIYEMVYYTDVSWEKWCGAELEFKMLKTTKVQSSESNISIDKFYDLSFQQRCK